MSGPQSTPLCEAMKNLLKAIEEIPPKANELHLLHAYDALLKALPSEKKEIADMKHDLERAVANHAADLSSDKLDEPLTREHIERIRAAFRCFSDNDEQKRRLDALCNLALSAQSATDATAKDAARYRWLRDAHNTEAENIIGYNSEEDLDAAIDARMGAVDSGNAR